MRDRELNDAGGAAIPHMSQETNLDEQFRGRNGLERALTSLDRPPVVVVGLCSHGLAIVRTFARKGIPVFAIESDFHQPSARTRYGIKVHCSSLYGPDLLRLLDAIGQRAAHKPLLLVTNDKMVRLVNPHQAELRKRFHLAFPDPGLLDRLIDKEPLAEIMQSRGLRIPETRLAGSIEAARRGAAEVGYPCIVKPAEPMSTFKALLVRDEATLTRVLESHPEISRFVLQTWIEGGDEQIIFTYFYFGKDGRPLASFVGQKIRQHPRFLGAGSAARGIDRPDLIEEGLKLFDGLGYTGLGSVEFKLDPQGTPYFIEPTVGRTDYPLKTSLVNGVDLVSAAYDDLALGRAVASPPQKNRKAWVDLDRDWEVYLESFLDPDLRKADLIGFLFEPKSLELWDVRDPVPFLAWLPHLAKRVVSKFTSRLKHRPS